MPENKSKQPRDNSPEARRERARKRKQSAAATLRAIANDERKKRTQRLIALGAPVDLAGLGAWDENLLLGAMLALKKSERSERWPALELEWREAGAKFRADRKAEREAQKVKPGVPVAVEFPRPFDQKEDKETRKALYAAGLRWVKELGVWVGTVDLEAAYAVVSQFGGVLERRDAPPGEAPAGGAGAERVH